MGIEQKNENGESTNKSAYQRATEMMPMMRTCQILTRDLEDYLHFLNLKENDLVGKKILDIGSGAAIFAKEAKQKGIEVTAIDPMYSDSEGREYFNTVWVKENFRPRGIAGVNQELPFKNEKFDTVICMFSSFHYAQSEEDIQRNLTESLRVLRDNGTLYICPVDRDENNNRLSINCESDKQEYKLSEYFFGLLEYLKVEGKIDWSVNMPNRRPGWNPYGLGYIQIKKIVPSENFKLPSSKVKKIQ